MLKLLDKIRRHSTVAGGNFDKMFEGIEIPPLPAAITRLVTEVNKEEPDLPQLSKMITATPEIASKVLSTVNSAYFSLPHQVTSIKHGVTILGLNNIKPLVLSFAMKESLPNPKGSIFQPQHFWSDALLKALLARALSDIHCKSEREEAFTVMLLADVALPVLLSAWGEYYEPLVLEWQTTSHRLSLAERNSFQWDHSQAGAWILQNWGFPAELVCFVGLHNSNLELLQELELEDTIALPVISASMLPSCRRLDPGRADRMIETVSGYFQFKPESLMAILGEVRKDFCEICSMFDLGPHHGQEVLDLLNGKLEILAGESE
ncbi:MAG: HDOD domain-containing protein [Candidatus Sedimenticola sp. 4PFRAG1]